MAFKSDKPLPLAVDFYYVEPKGHEILFYLLPFWPQGTKSSDIDKNAIENYLTDFLFIRSVDKPFFHVQSIRSDKFIFVFKGHDWISANFLNSPRVKYDMLRTIEWRLKKFLPVQVLSHTPWEILKPFLIKEFNEFLKNNGNSVFRQRFRLLKKVNFDWFDYDLDLQMGVFYMRVKTKVLITLAAAGYAIKGIFF
jgi:hypothetical protein